MRKPLPGNKISLTDLIALDELQEMQDSFAEVASVAIRIVDPKGNNITQMSSPPSLCAEILNDPAVKDKVCGGCRPTFLGGEGIVDDDLSFECMPGLKSYLLPLKVESSSESSLILGYFIIGPVIFMKRRTREEYKDIAEKLGVTPKLDTMTREEFLRRWPDKAPSARHRIYNGTRLIETTGYRPRIPLREAIAETVEWMESVTR